MYVCRTRDFNTFSEPKVWLSEDQDSGKEVNIIDTTIVQDNGQYYRFSTSDWNTVIDTSSTLSEDLFDVRVNANQSENGDWKRIVTRSSSSSADLIQEKDLLYTSFRMENCVQWEITVVIKHL